MVQLNTKAERLQSSKCEQICFAPKFLCVFNLFWFSKQAKQNKQTKREDSGKQQGSSAACKVCPRQTDFDGVENKQINTMGKAHRVSWMRSKKLNNQVFTRLHQHINVLITDTWKIARLESLKWPSPHKVLWGLRSSAETNTPPFEYRPDLKSRNESGPESFLSSLAVGSAHLSTYKWVFFLRSLLFF